MTARDGVWGGGGGGCADILGDGEHADGDVLLQLSSHHV